MNPETEVSPERVVFAVILVTGAIIGMRSTYLLVRTYFRLKAMHPPVRTIIAAAFVLVAGIVTVAVAWLGGITLYRLVGNPSPDWAPFITAPAVAAVSLIPYILNKTFDRVAWQITDGHPERQSKGEDIT